MMVNLASLHDPIERDNVDAPEEFWFDLSLSVAIHRYFLHVDDALTADFALNFGERRQLFSSAKQTAGAKRKAALVQQIARAFGAGTSARPVDVDSWTVLALDPNRLGDDANARLSDTLRRMSAAGHQGIVGLGAMSIVAVRSLTPRPSWTRLLGIVCVPSDLEATEAVRVLLGQAVENLSFAFLYAGLREGYIPGDQDGTVEEIADSLMREHSDALASLNQFGASLLDRTRPAVAEECLQARKLGSGDVINYMPLTDFVDTMTNSPTYLDRYLRGIGTGQS